MDAGDGQFGCPLCTKSFLSLKALYGHMRCHPERKGIKLPSPMLSSSSSSSKQVIRPHSDDSSTVIAPQNWCATARSTTAQPTSPGDDDHDDDDEEEEEDSMGSSYQDSMDSGDSVINAARILMHLRFHGTRWDVADTSWASTSSGDMDAPAVDSGDYHMGTEEEVNSETRNPCRRPTPQQLGEKKKKKKKKRDVTSTVASGGIKKTYRCGTCNNKAFPSHGKGTSRHGAASDVSEDGVGGGGGDDDDGDGSKHRPGGRYPSPAHHREHPCYLCDKVFGSGQALGGHMRKHWDGLKNRAAAPAAAEDTVHKASSVEEKTSSGRMLHVDLNEPVSEEFGDRREEEEQQTTARHVMARGGELIKRKLHAEEHG